jgi:hypothetical protein
VLFVTNVTSIWLLYAVCFHMCLHAIIRLEPQHTAWPTTYKFLTSLVPADVRSQLGWPPELFLTPWFMALVTDTFFLYIAEFSF